MAIGIVVAQRGWVLVGNVWFDGEYHIIDGGSVVRRWGTTNGLGELASKGPLEETILDPCPRVKVHSLTSVMIMDCNESKWANSVNTKIPQEPSPKNQIELVVAQRGWILIGEVSTKGVNIIIDGPQTAVVRRWGTTKGLGELAQDGKLPNTALDSCPRVVIHELSSVLFMECNQKAWGK